MARPSIRRNFCARVSGCHRADRNPPHSRFTNAWFSPFSHKGEIVTDLESNGENAAGDFQPARLMIRNLIHVLNRTRRRPERALRERRRHELIEIAVEHA